MSVSSTEPEVRQRQADYAEAIQQELDRRVFNLRTLYDVSREIFNQTDCEAILKTFLMMIMGNFGVLEGFIVLEDPSEPKLHAKAVYGLDPRSMAAALRTLGAKPTADAILADPDGHHPFTTCTVSAACTLLTTRFTPSAAAEGALGLGPKLDRSTYSEDDRELVRTLLNNLVIALQNARAFAKICRLNESLEERNRQLEETLEKLQSALRKVEILESIKTSLSKFVPNTVCQMLENSPSADLLASKEQDVSVLFLDIEGYTRICEKLSGVELNQLVERCFSPVMEAIHSNNGDVNETAGDGLMVLFLDQDPNTNALQAVRTALQVWAKISHLVASNAPACPRLVINIGINSGSALVGAAKFDSYTGSRWTYTARGPVTNLAARLGAFATGGRIVLSKTTADRIRDHYQPLPLGSATLKNISKPVEIFAL